MGFVIINQSRGEYVEMDTATCKYNITKDVSKSHHFKKRVRATNFLQCDTQKILTKSGWEVVSDAMLKEIINGGNIKIHEDEVPEKVKPFIEASSKIDLSIEDMEKLKNFKHFDADEELSKSFEVPNIDIIGTIKQFELFLKKMKDYADVLSKQYTYIESCKLDFEHKMEFDGKDLNFIKRAELMTNYATCLEERRRIKDDILVLEKLLTASIEDLINGELDEFFKTLENRFYRPRVAPELFTEKETVQVKPCFKFDSLQRDKLTDDAEQLHKSFDLPTENQNSLLEMISGFDPIEDCGE